MRNSLIADSLGFPASILLDEGFQKRWGVFRGTEQAKFLQLLLEKWIAELKLLIENAEPEDLKRLQGQVIEAKKILAFLAQPSIANEVKSMITWLNS